MDSQNMFFCFIISQGGVLWLLIHDWSCAFDSKHIFTPELSSCCMNWYRKNHKLYTRQTQGLLQGCTLFWKVESLVIWKECRSVKKTNEIKEKNIWEWCYDCDWMCNFLKWRSKRYGLITEHLSIILHFCCWSCSWRILIRTQSAQVFYHYILPFSLLTQSCSYLEVLLQTQLHSLLS